jgi:hypothetical protein
MTFLQPWVLLALPLVALPLIIHLINQRRFQTVQWAAMMFLLSARALSRGYSRLRHWLIMALRMAAVAAVILAVGRPLSRGWLALAGGGRPDTAIVILDRSPSMQARDPAAVETKLDTARRQLAESLTTLRPARCVVLADPDSPPLEIADPAALADVPATGPTAAPADMPRLLQAAYDYIRDNAAGASEIWIGSDQRANDWAAESGGWTSLREAFARLPQPVRFQLVSFAAPAGANTSIRVTGSRLERRGGERVLVLSLAARRDAATEPRMLPVTIEIGGGLSTVELSLEATEGALNDHVIPLASDVTSGQGRVSIPADANAADNEFFFAFAEPPARRSLVVAEQSSVGRTLALVAGIPPDKVQEATVETIAAADLTAGAIADVALLLWQGPLPDADRAPLVEAFVARGGQVIFFPPEEPGSLPDAPGSLPEEPVFAGVGWTMWTDHAEPVRPVTWRADQDVLANTLSGAALPVGELEIRRSCGLRGEFVPLASLADAAPLLARGLLMAAGESADGAGMIASGGNAGSVLFCATTPAARDSTLASEGIVLYGLVQRSIDRGLTVLGAARQVDAGTEGVGFAAGVTTTDGRIVAVNRPLAEDVSATLADDRVDGLFGGLSFARVAGRAGRGDSLVQEIWRAFLIATVLALIGEGLLSLPGRMARAASGTRSLAGSLAETAA